MDDFEKWFESRIFGHEYEYEDLQAAFAAGQSNKHSEAPLGSPTRYTDGTVSREYDDQPTQNPLASEEHCGSQECWCANRGDK